MLADLFYLFTSADCNAYLSVEITSRNNGIFYFSWMEQRDAINRVRTFKVNAEFIFQLTYL